MVASATTNSRGSKGRLSNETGLRFHQVLDDHLDPTIRARDYVLLSPVDRWAGEGYYLIQNHFGVAQGYHCSAIATRAGEIRLECHNKHYTSQTITRAKFDELVLGKVAMICNVVQHDLLPDAWRNGQ